MYHGNDYPSEYSGKLATIIQRLDKYEFIKDINELPIKGKTLDQINSWIAKDIKYKAMIDKKIMILNHSCFLNDKENLEWKVSEKGSEIDYSQI